VLRFETSVFVLNRSPTQCDLRLKAAVTHRPINKARYLKSDACAWWTSEVNKAQPYAIPDIIHYATQNG